MIISNTHPTHTTFMNTSECPTCGKPFESERGMRTHHSLAHGERIGATVQCANCGDEKVVKPAEAERHERHFCSTECMSTWKSENVEPHNKSVIEKSCTQCGDRFEVSPSESDRRFCSQECYHEHNRETGARAGENNARWKPDIELECDWCGSDFSIPPSREETARFCSRSCLYDWMSSQTGSDHPLWRGGREWYRTIRSSLGPSDWKQERSRHLGERCDLCGEESDRLDLHHIVSLLAGGTNDEYNYLTLCPSCHPKAEAYTRNLSESEILLFD